nr:hypothetical protein [uncultured bacterium]
MAGVQRSGIDRCVMRLVPRRRKEMPGWNTLLIKCYTVNGSGRECQKEFNDFDEAAAFLEKMRDKYPDGWAELSALIDA